MGVVTYENIQLFWLWSGTRSWQYFFFITLCSLFLSATVLVCCVFKCWTLRRRDCPPVNRVNRGQDMEKQKHSHSNSYLGSGGMLWNLSCPRKPLHTWTEHANCVQKNLGFNQWCFCSNDSITNVITVLSALYLFIHIVWQFIFS